MGESVSLLRLAMGTLVPRDLDDPEIMGLPNLGDTPACDAILEGVYDYWLGVERRRGGAVDVLLEASAVRWEHVRSKWLST